MRVEAIEMGDRPATWSRARRYAPAGAKVFGELFGQQEFADEALIVLDWTNELGSMPDEVAQPILHLRVRKHLPEYAERNVLQVDARLDVESVFGDDSITAETIAAIVQEFKDKIEEQLTMRRES